MSLWGAGTGSEGSLAVAAVKGPARGKGICHSWSLGPGLNIKIRPVQGLVLFPGKQLMMERCLGKELGSGGQGGKECYKNSWMLVSSLETLGRKVPCP